MKYTIEGFSQKYILTLSYTEILKNGKEKVVKPEWIDLGLLRYFVDFYPNMKKVEIDGKQYAWLAYSKVLEDLPFIDLNKRSIALHFNKLCNLGLLEQKVFGQGQTVFRFGPKYAGMVDSKQADKISASDVKFQQLTDETLTYSADKISAESADKISATINLLNNTSIINIEKNTKEINKEISSGSETTRDTDMSVSLTEGEKLTPNPLIKDKQEFIQEINKYTQDTKLRELLTDYLISRLEQNPNMSLINFKASLATLTEAACYCEIPDFSMEYQYRVVINATTASYSQFKPIFDKKYKSNQVIQESSNKVPFGDHSRCIPAGADLELALDDNGNPIKF